MVGTKKALTDTPTDEAVPAWAPDGDTIAFQFEKDGRWVIHLMRADGSERRELINNGAWAAQPKWSNSGSDTLPVVPSVLQIQQWGKIRAYRWFIYPHFLFKGCVERVLIEKV